MKIAVTEQDIKDGIPETLSECPIARAVSRQKPGEKVRVGPMGTDGGWFVELNETVWAPLPEEAEEFAERFDDGRPVQPFSFYVDLPEVTQ